MRKHRKVNWVEIDPFMGTDTDKNIGKRFNVSKVTLAARRLSLGIACYSPAKTMNWDLIDDELGKAIDKELAEKHGCSISTINTRRTSLGIPPYGGKSSVFDWSRVDWSMGDRTLAKLFKDDGIGCRTSVAKKRKELGIPPTPRGQAVPLTDEILSELGGIHDSHLAKKHGISPPTVRRWRERMGIPPHAAGHKCKHVRHDWSLAEPYWGKATDTEISNMTGIPRETVTTRRTQKGLPKYKKPKEDTECQESKNP